MEAPSVDGPGLAPAVRPLESYLEQAVARGASNLHFGPSPVGDRSLVVRMRVDGLLHTLEPLPVTCGLAHLG